MTTTPQDSSQRGQTPSRCPACYDSFSGPWCDNCEQWPCKCMTAPQDSSQRGQTPSRLDEIEARLAHDDYEVVDGLYRADLRYLLTVARAAEETLEQAVPQLDAGDPWIVEVGAIVALRAALEAKCTCGLSAILANLPAAAMDRIQERDERLVRPWREALRAVNEHGEWARCNCAAHRAARALLGTTQHETEARK